ncbi:sec-independent protein translocase protein TatC [Marchantia polymorpha subsp. ruderalis]|uniref:Sec-independent protein translocase protein TATC, chloroplastic n=2 Tax=Marchantia polymorpha TaxID=3197 RepID=A0AAF6BLN0_MARPO|nr:hypothetical protein MARPO_0010s0061 [Marchantia polymorpha]BBN12914.1 hypothetical protein Mp_5g23950 [Marchantia polymorpha subsp. ruderalis]|eukprot:PTQ46657.1 hypothetical protein MARPO_0010s0061 [Marchantia polymorpha]
MAGALQIVSPSLAVGHGIGVETLRCWSKAGGLSMASSSSSLYCRIDSLSVRRARCGSWIQNSSRVDGPARAWRLSQRSKGNSSRCRAERDDENSAGRGSVQDEAEEESQLQSGLSSWLYPSKDELPDEKEMTIWDHLEELRERILVSVAAVGVAILGCFAFAKDLIVLLEAPVYSQGVRFLQLSPGEYFFTTLKVSGYCGLLIGSPVILYEIIAFVVPGLTRSERRFLGPIVLGSSVLFYTGVLFSYKVLTPAALNFFVNYAEGVVESLWSIDQYFEFVLVLLFSTGLAFQVPVIQLLLGQTRIVTGEQMLSVWRYVVVGSVVVAAVLTPSTDPLTQLLLAGPLIFLYMGGAFLVKFLAPVEEPSN